MSKQKGGRKRLMTNLEIRQRLWDVMSENKKRGTKRPGSNKK